MAGDTERDLPTEELQLAFSEALLGPVGMIACPPAEEVWDALHGGLGAEARSAVVDHVAGCPMCAEAWRLARRGDAPG